LFCSGKQKEVYSLTINPSPGSPLESIPPENPKVQEMIIFQNFISFDIFCKTYLKQTLLKQHFGSN
jgi:hypothetical protein